MPVVWAISPHSSTRQLVGLNLSKRGFRVLEASSPSGAELADARPDLIVVDVDPPDESGWEAVPCGTMPRCGRCR